MNKFKLNMKRVFAIFLCITFCALSFAQKTFNHELLSFTYPSYFKESPIKNAPHMILKLESEKYLFSISYWNYNLDESIDVWNDDIYNRYKGFIPDKNANFVSIEKVLIKTKNSTEHCLKIKTNTTKNNIKLKTLFYIMKKGSCLFVFTFLSEGSYTTKTSTTYTDNIMKGLLLKNIIKNEHSNTISLETKNKIKNRYIAICREMNAQLPVKVDEITTLNSILFINWTITCTYKTDIDVNDYTDSEIKEINKTLYDEGKDLTKNFLMKVSSDFSIKDLSEFMRTFNLKFRRNYTDINNKFICSIVYDYNDFK